MGNNVTEIVPDKKAGKDIGPVGSIDLPSSLSSTQSEQPNHIVPPLKEGYSNGPRLAGHALVLGSGASVPDFLI